MEVKNQGSYFSIDVYFDDLTSKAQKDLMKAFGIKDSKEMNWDVFPLFEIIGQEQIPINESIK